MEDVKKNKKIGENLANIQENIKKTRKVLSFLASILRFRLNIKKLIRIFSVVKNWEKLGKGRSPNRKQILRKKMLKKILQNIHEFYKKK